MNLPGIAFGLASALSWGAGDFCGGLVTRRSPVYGVVLISQFLGFGLLVALALLLGEPLPTVEGLLLAGGAGLAGGLGLVALYQGLALGPMGVVAPVAALVSAGVPVLFGAWFEGPPAPRQMAGFGLALGAIWLVSRPPDASRTRAQSLVLPILAGLGFGLFLILIDRVSEAAVLWPLAAARLSSVLFLSAVLLAVRQGIRPLPGTLPLLVLVGLFDTGGNAFYALAARAGRLDVAAVLSSLYPAVTVVLACFFSAERIAMRQWLGLAAALAGVVLITP